VIADDQILGHAITDTSRLYTNVPQPPLIEAINTLPTIPEWLDQDWMKTPVALVARRAKRLKKPERAAGIAAYNEWQKTGRPSDAALLSKPRMPCHQKAT
jgi:integrase/recombinase XerD